MTHKAVNNTKRYPEHLKLKFKKKLSWKLLSFQHMLMASTYTIYYHPPHFLIHVSYNLWVLIKSTLLQWVAFGRECFGRQVCCFQTLWSERYWYLLVFYQFDQIQTTLIDNNSKSYLNLTPEYVYIYFYRRIIMISCL